MKSYSDCDVLILEDEILVAAQLEEYVAEIGCRPHVAYSVPEALRLVELQRFDLALLDMILDDELSLSVARAVMQRGIPYAVMTGHQSETVREVFGDAPVLAKPFDEPEVVAMLARLKP